MIDKTCLKCYNKKVMTGKDKTIIAIASALGPGAIGIIRISGKDALRGVTAAFKPFRTRIPEPNHVYHGVLEAGNITDDAVAVYYRAPRSYTGEDSVELFCHGSPALLRGVVNYFITEQGFTQAEGGDFTARAFANGKIDLTGAEGIYDVINAETEAEMRGAYSLLSGELRRRIEKLQSAVVTARAKTEAAIDYPEEDVEVETAEELTDDITEIQTEINALIDSFKTGRIVRDGVRVALVGKPNAGKSSLMNALLGYDRAIVTAEKGTTRDTLTESYIYNGMKFVLTDTAGLRETQSLPERQGVERAKVAANECDVAIVVAVAGEHDEETDSFAKKLAENGRKVIIAENKIDLQKPEIEGAVVVSAVTGEGIDELKSRIFKASEVTSTGGASINNMRQLSCVRDAKVAIDRAKESLGTVPPELISADLYEAYAALGRITGVTGSDALAEEIFKKFCVGK